MYFCSIIPDGYMQANYEILCLKFMLKELSSSKCSILMVNVKEKIVKLNYALHTEINQFIRSSLNLEWNDKPDWKCSFSPNCASRSYDKYIYICVQFSESSECTYMQPAFRSFITYNLRAFNSCFLDFNVFNHVHCLQVCYWECF